MAELAVFNLACNILLTVAFHVFEKAYEKGLSIWEAREELVKLRVTIETIQAVLLDAEKKQEGSTAVKSWIKRLKGVLYNADDLFEEVVTDDLLKQQIMKGKGNVFSKKVVKCVVRAFELKQLQYNKGIEQQHETKSKRGTFMRTFTLDTNSPSSVSLTCCYCLDFYMNQELRKCSLSSISLDICKVLNSRANCNNEGSPTPDIFQETVLCTKP